MGRKKNIAAKGTLNVEQEEFCQLYATSADFFGNGVEAYVEVYDIDKGKPNWYKSACSAASRLLSNVKVIERINELLVETGFNEVAVDKQHAFLIAQHEDKHVKLGAIKEFNRLRGRVTEKMEVTRPLEEMSDEELMELQRSSRAALTKK